MSTYRIMFIGGMVAFIMFLILAVVIFIVLNIPKAFGVVTGRAEKRAIEQIRKAGYERMSKQEAIRNSSGRIKAREADMNTDKQKKHRKKKQGETSEKLEALDPEKEIKIAQEAAREAELRKEEERRVFEENQRIKNAIKKAEGPTDVLEERIKQGEEKTAVLDIESGEEKTDLLDDLKGEEETELLEDLRSEDTTDALASYNAEAVTDALSSGESDMDVLGNYSPEETAVLKDMHNTRYSATGVIKVLYSETVVHTDEILDI